jgi:hypothetical protein
LRFLIIGKSRTESERAATVTFNLYKSHLQDETDPELIRRWLKQTLIGFTDLVNLRLRNGAAKDCLRIKDGALLLIDPIQRSAPLTHRLDLINLNASRLLAALGGSLDAFRFDHATDQDDSSRDGGQKGGSRLGADAKAVGDSNNTDRRSREHQFETEEFYKRSDRL